MKDNFGSTPLHYAAASGHVEAVKIILSWPGVQVNIANNVGDLPIHKASWKGYIAIVKELVNAGADLTASNKDKKRAIDIARTPEVAALLTPVSNVDYPYSSSSEDDEGEKGSEESD